MKRQFLANIFAIFAILLAVSCTTTDTATSSLVGAADLNKEEAALFYMDEYEKNEDIRLLYNAAYSFIEAEDYVKAMEILNDGITKYPEYLRFHSAKAYVYKVQEDTSNYIDTLTIIHEIVPGDIEYAELLADALNNDGRQDDAIEIAKDILRRDSKNQTAFKILSQKYEFYKMYVKEEKPKAEVDNSEVSEKDETIIDETPIEQEIEESPIEVDDSSSNKGQ